MGEETLFLTHTHTHKTHTKTHTHVHTHALVGCQTCAPVVDLSRPGNAMSPTMVLMSPAATARRSSSAASMPSASNGYRKNFLSRYFASINAFRSSRLLLRLMGTAPPVSACHTALKTSVPTSRIICSSARGTSSSVTDRTLLTCTPRLRWIPEHCHSSTSNVLCVCVCVCVCVSTSLSRPLDLTHTHTSRQKTQPRFMEIHGGCDAPQSAHFLFAGFSCRIFNACEQKNKGGEGRRMDRKVTNVSAESNTFTHTHTHTHAHAHTQTRAHTLRAKAPCGNKDQPPLVRSSAPAFAMLSVSSPSVARVHANGNTRRKGAVSEEAV